LHVRHTRDFDVCPPLCRVRVRIATGRNSARRWSSALPASGCLSSSRAPSAPNMSCRHPNILHPTHVEHTYVFAHCSGRSLHFRLLCVAAKVEVDCCVRPFAGDCLALVTRSTCGCTCLWQVARVSGRLHCARISCTCSCAQKKVRTCSAALIGFTGIGWCPRKH
jgi:hypothetical protein